MKELLFSFILCSALAAPIARAESGSDSDDVAASGLPRVNVTASDPVAFGALSTGAFVVSRSGTTGDLSVTLSYSGTASNGVDFATLPTSVTIPDGSHAVGLTVQPLNGGALTQNKWVTATIVSADTYVKGRNQATVAIRANSFENEAPSVTITAPADNTSILARTDLTIAATASDDKGDPKVSFFANDHFLGSLSAPPYTLVWSNVPAGKFAIFARAEDSFGKSGVSSAVHVTATNPPVAVGSIKLTAPTPDSKFAAGSNIDLAASVTGNTTITSVSFLADGNVVGSATAAPYSMTWSNVVAGKHFLRATAVDASGGTLTSPGVEIFVTNPPPTVTITAPADKTTVDAGSNVDITATASSPNGAIANVMFFADGYFLGKATTTPYSLTWSNVPPGTHRIVAAATDAVGATAKSAAVTITASNTPPTVTLTAPADGATFTAPATIELKADASDSDGLRGVVFWRGNQPVGVSTTAPFTATTKIYAPGTYQFVAEAYDRFGARTKSAPVTVTVKAP
jgi:hypothetical protein